MTAESAASSAAGEFILAALDSGDPRRALNKALQELQAQAADMARERPADASLTMSELAGSILAAAATLSAHTPRRPPGCPDVPRPRDLKAVFNHALTREEGSRE